MSSEAAGSISSLWLLLLACTAALVCVALMRRPCRRWFGAESALQLWWLPVLGMLASQLPHAATANSGALSGATWALVSAADAWPYAHKAPFDWGAMAVVLWIVGAMASLLRAALAQRRYGFRLRDAVPLSGVSLPWPVLRAASSDTGPALVGACRPRIVVPADFEQRYTRIEQALVLAHEAMHARRWDGRWSLLAQLFASLFWFHPLVWWALAAMRHDQELACDAAVLRERVGCRRSYAQAMLKTPATAQPLPVGCSWLSRHPLTERIAMLKSSSPSSFRRRVGQFCGLALASTMAVVVYAASAPVAPLHQQQAQAAGVYQLAIQLALTSNAAQASHVRRWKAALCMVPGEVGTLRSEGMQLDAVARELAPGRVYLDLAVREKAGDAPARARLQSSLDQAVETSGKVPGGDVRYTLEVTPRRGCPAAAVAAADR